MIDELETLLIEIDRLPDPMQSVEYMYRHAVRRAIFEYIEYLLEEKTNAQAVCNKGCPRFRQVNPCT